MFALDLFNNDHERRLSEGAVDQLEQRRIDDLAMKMDDLVARAKTATTAEVKQALMKEFQKCKAERDSYFKIKSEAGIPGNVPVEKIPGKEDLLKGRGRSYYEDQKKNSKEIKSREFGTTNIQDPTIDQLLTKAHRERPKAKSDAEALAMKILGKEQDDVKRLDQVNDREDRMIAKLDRLEQDLQNQINDLKDTKTLDEDQRLHVGDPITVTAPNEFEGKTGEIVEFSPSGKFVIVDLYNHGQHSMHLSDVEFNQYAADQEDEDDWYDKEMDEGYAAAISPDAPPLDPIKQWKINVRQLIADYIKNPQGLYTLAKQKGANSAEATAYKYIMHPKGKIDLPPDAVTFEGYQNSSDSPVAGAITRRILSQRLDLLKQYGPELVGAAVDDVADYVGDVEEIGSSDVSGWVAQVERMLNENPPEAFAEGFQDFNKVEPYAVCLAGKPVKKFDYYEQARRFHDNWKQKLYREGNKEKADKITLMPLNLDEQGVAEGQQPMNRNAVIQKLEAIYTKLYKDEDPESYDMPAAVMYWRGLPADQLAMEFEDAIAKLKQSRGAVAEAEDRVDPILIKALNRMPDGLATHGEVLDACYDAYAMELGRMAMKSNYGTTNAYIPQLMDLYKQKHGLTFNEAANPAQQAAIAIAMKKAGKKPKQVNELSTEKLAQYKKAAGADAGAADKAGNFERGNKRFKGIVNATNKQFDNDAKKQQGVAEDTGSWIVYDPETKQIKKRFKTHTAGKSYARTHGLDFASSEYYFDNIKQAVTVEAIVASGPSRPLDDRAVRKLVWDTMKINADTGEQALQQALSMLAKKPQSRMVQNLKDKFQNLADRLEQGLAETVTDVKSQMAKVYNRLAPKIERHRDSFLAGQLYDELENIAELHGAEDEFKRMMAGARNRAHMDYDTNPGGFQNWFWYLPFDNDEEVVEGKVDYNFNAEDLKRLERIRDLPTLKAQAFALISKPSAKPMKPEKVEWFKQTLEKMNSPLKVIKLMYDLLLSGEGHAVVGSKSSMNPNSYRQKFGEDSSTSSDAVERAILNRIMVAHTDLLMKFGPDKVMQAAEEVAYNVGDVDEIGTSDVSAYVNQVKQILGVEA